MIADARRMAALFVSAKKGFPVASTAMPKGALSDDGKPSAKPALPLPASVSTLPRGVMARIRCVPASLTYTRGEKKGNTEGANAMPEGDAKPAFVPVAS